MVDWLDAHFSDGSDSSDEEFVFHEEDAAEDTSDSSEEGSSDADQNSVANQNHHTVNGNSTAKYRITSPIQVNGNGHGLDENGYTNGKVGTNSRRDDSGSFFPYSEQLPNRPLRKLGAPFEIFSDTLNQFHDEQETMLKELKETEHEMLQMNTQLEEDIEVVKEDCNDLKAEYRDICEENKQIREYIEEMHSFLIPYLNNIVGTNDNDEDDEGVKDMDIDKKNSNEDNEEKDEETNIEFNDMTLGPFLIELFRQQQQQRQQEEQKSKETNKISKKRRSRKKTKTNKNIKVNEINNKNNK